MESLLKQVPLTQDVVRVLDEIRAGAENALYGAGSDESEELFAALCGELYAKLFETLFEKTFVSLFESFSRPKFR